MRQIISSSPEVILHEIENGGVGVFAPMDSKSPIKNFLHVVPEGMSYRVGDPDDIPVSDNWRNAWRYGPEVYIDLEQAKILHKKLMVAKARERITPDDFGRQDYSTVESEINIFDFASISTLTELYNTWPASIELRKEAREYIVLP